jgi:tetratricopeptide (TPR) repeat protein
VGFGGIEFFTQVGDNVVVNRIGFGHGWTALGVAYARNGQHDKVENAFRRALEIDPANPHALRNLGALRNQAAPEEALEDLWKAARLLPKDQGAQFAYARCLLDLGQAIEADAILTKVIELDPLSDIAEMAKAERRKLAHETMRAGVDGGLRMDAVFYCLDALKKFGEMSHEKMRSVVFEIAVLGQGGLDINDPDAQYTLKSLPGTYSGLHLVSLMYVGFKMINPSLDGGIDLSREYTHARKLAGLS